MQGLVHIYCGDGKGKTTAAMGLALRAAGAGKKVLITQFYKDGSSCEFRALEHIDGIKIMHCKRHFGLFFKMSPQEQTEAREAYSKLLEKVLREAENAELLILDEAVSACNNGTISEDRLIDFLMSRQAGPEVVLTGRNPSQRLLSCGDYVTEMKKIKHPFDRGIPAREGIEF
ncbi:MAG: cob(I)yrinic acid a,c-diamide adenosyltransferase [Candidatus Limivicinus sp.]|jgi:cob(I)alamin adenosyltransferase